MQLFMLDCSTINLSNIQQRQTNETKKSFNGVEHKQIVLRSFEVISRIDSIQIYNSTVEQQQSTVIQPMPTSQLAELSIQRARFDIYIYSLSTRKH